MAKKRFSVEQIIAAVKLHESGMSVAVICRKLDIAGGTFCRLRKEYELESDQLR